MAHLSLEEPKARKFFAPLGLAHARWRQYINHESVVYKLIGWLVGHWPGLPTGDVQRMQGAFLLVEGGIRKAYRRKRVSDRPDYLALTTPGSFAGQGVHLRGIVRMQQDR